MTDTADTLRVNDAGEIIADAVRKSRCTGRTDYNFALAVLAGEILALRDCLRDCAVSLESKSSGEIPEPALVAARLLLDRLQPAVPLADQPYAASES